MGFGHRLLDNIRTLPPQAVSQSLDDWRKDLRTELCNNISGQLSTRHVSLASNIPDNFPSLHVVDSYLNPVVHDDREFNTDYSIVLSSGESCAVELAKFSISHFHWGRTAQGIIKRYGNAFFPAMAIRQLIKAAVDIDKGRALPDSGCPMIGKIIRRREAPDTCFLQEVRVLLIISLKMIQQICASLPGPTVTDAEILMIRHAATKFRAWLPTDMVHVVLPARLATFERESIVGMSDSRWPIYESFMLLSCLSETSKKRSQYIAGESMPPSLGPRSSTTTTSNYASGQ